MAIPRAAVAVVVTVDLAQVINRLCYKFRKKSRHYTGGGHSSGGSSGGGYSGSSSGREKKINGFVQHSRYITFPGGHSGGGSSSGGYGGSSSGECVHHAFMM